MDERLFQLSGLNSNFDCADLAFPEYINKTHTVLSKARIDGSDPTVVETNAPFEWRPEKPNGKGVLLIHGLYDSPFSMQDLGQWFYQQGFLVRSILLPGHGTIPGDLLKVRHQAWEKAVAYGIKSFRNEVEQLFVVGFSLGGALALQQAAKNPAVDGLVLFAPALRLRNKLLHFPGSEHYIKLSRTINGWYKKTEQINIAKYESFTTNAAYQAWLVMKNLRKTLRKQAINTPMFVVSTDTDETISHNGVLNFFTSSNNPKNRMLCYSNSQKTFRDTRIIERSSAFPTKKIINFSHCSLTSSPSNTYYGEKGRYQDFSHYNNTPQTDELPYLGAINKQTLKKPLIQRLNYNPDFDGMVKLLAGFLDSVCNNSSS